MVRRIKKHHIFGVKETKEKERKRKQEKKSFFFVLVIKPDVFLRALVFSSRAFAFPFLTFLYFSSNICYFLLLFLFSSSSSSLFIAFNVYEGSSILDFVIRWKCFYPGVPALSKWPFSVTFLFSLLNSLFSVVLFGF